MAHMATASQPLPNHHGGLSMNLRRRIQAQLAPKTPEQRDAEHRAWINTPEGLIEIIKFPTQARLPSLRTAEENRQILINNIRNWKKK